MMSACTVLSRPGLYENWQLLSYPIKYNYLHRSSLRVATNAGHWRNTYDIIRKSFVWVNNNVQQLPFPIITLTEYGTNQYRLDHHPKPLRRTCSRLIASSTELSAIYSTISFDCSILRKMGSKDAKKSDKRKAEEEVEEELPVKKDKKVKKEKVEVESEDEVNKNKKSKKEKKDKKEEVVEEEEEVKSAKKDKKEKKVKAEPVEEESEGEEEVKDVVEKKAKKDHSLVKKKRSPAAHQRRREKAKLKAKTLKDKKGSE